ncbi:MAG: hypothetical protein ACM3XZ_09925 [Betaproteobacteria bacterium]
MAGRLRGTAVLLLLAGALLALFLVRGLMGRGEKPAAPARRPPEKAGTIMLEGYPEKFRFVLFAPEGFPFTTYVPQDLFAEEVVADGGRSVRFVANFAGRRTDLAYLQVFFYPEGTREDQARALFGSLPAALGFTPVGRRTDVPCTFAWSLAETTFQRKGWRGEVYRGEMALGRHGRRFFHLILHYPEEFAEGFVPRAYAVLSEWRWTEGTPGAGLTPERPRR